MRRTLIPLLLALLILVASPAMAQDAPDAPNAPDAGDAAAAPKEGEPEIPEVGTIVPESLGGGLKITLGDNDDGTGVGTAIRIAILLTVLTVAPGLMLTLTCFTRIIIVLSFIRRAMALQTLPPNQVLVGLSLFLTLAVMFPVFTDIKTQAYDPFQAGEMSVSDATGKAAERLSTFLAAQTREADIALFLEIARAERPTTPEDVPFHVLVPSYILSELRTAFQMGFLIFLPFLIVDLVIAGILLSMGMFMLPPTIISTPFKIILFVLLDGWNLVIKSLFASFGGI
jgi:flagellar biosynthesis protein FliP